MSKRRPLIIALVLCLARLMSVSEDYFESARVDGARWWRILWHVTIPQLTPAIAFYAVAERQLVGGLTAGAVKG